MTSTGAHLALEESLARHAGQRFGGGGFREVVLASYCEGGLRRDQLRVLHVWTITSQRATSLFLIREPPLLAGTTLTMVEPCGEELGDVVIGLKTSARPIRVAPRRAFEPFLGTEFSYEHLRLWLPVRTFDAPARAVTVGPDDGVVSGTAVRPTPWGERLQYSFSLDRRSGCLRSLEIRGSHEASRSLFEALDFRIVDAISTPTLMKVTSPSGGYSTHMRFLAGRYGPQSFAHMIPRDLLRHPLPPCFA